MQPHTKFESQAYVLDAEERALIALLYLMQGCGGT